MKIELPATLVKLIRTFFLMLVLLPAAVMGVWYVTYCAMTLLGLVGRMPL